MEWEKVSYQLERHWLGCHTASIMRLYDGNIVACIHHHNTHFLSCGNFYMILTSEEINRILDILNNMTDDLPIHFGGSFEYSCEDYVDCTLSLYGVDGTVKKSGNEYVVEKLEELFKDMITEREKLLPHIENGFIRCITFKDIAIEYDAKDKRYILINYQKTDNEIIIISKEEIAKISNTLFDDSILPHENDSKWVCDINRSFSIYCNSASYEKVFLVLNGISEKMQDIICGVAELSRKVMDRSKIPIVVLVNKHMKEIQFLTTDGYVYKISFTEQWNQEKCLSIISYALEMGTYSLTKKWNQKWVDFLKYHLESVLKWDDYNQFYDYRQTYRVFYNLNGNLMQVGIYEVAGGRKKIRLQQIPNDKHCLGVILGMQEKHSLFWN